MGPKSPDRPSGGSDTPLSSDHSRLQSSSKSSVESEVRLAPGSKPIADAAQPRYNVASPAGSRRATVSYVGSPDPAGGPVAPSLAAENTKLKTHSKSTASQDKQKSAGSDPSKRRSTGNNALPSTIAEEAHLITKNEVVEVLRNRSMTMKELLAHFDSSLRDQKNQARFFAILQKSTIVKDGRLFLSEKV